MSTRHVNGWGLPRRFSRLEWMWLAQRKDGSVQGHERCVCMSPSHSVFSDLPAPHSFPFFCRAILKDNRPRLVGTKTEHSVSKEGQICMHRRCNMSAWTNCMWFSPRLSVNECCPGLKNSPCNQKHCKEKMPFCLLTSSWRWSDQFKLAHSVDQQLWGCVPENNAKDWSVAGDKSGCRRQIIWLPEHTHFTDCRLDSGVKIQLIYDWIYVVLPFIYAIMPPAPAWRCQGVAVEHRHYDSNNFIYILYINKVATQPLVKDWYKKIAT